MKKILTCLDRSELLGMAEKLGFTIRQRDIRPLDFILSLIDALAGDGNCDTQTGLHRKFNELTGLNVSCHSCTNQAKKYAKPGSYMVRPAVQGKVFHHDFDQ